MKRIGAIGVLGFHLGSYDSYFPTAEEGHCENERIGSRGLEGFHRSEEIRR